VLSNLAVYPDAREAYAPFSKVGRRAPVTSTLGLTFDHRANATTIDSLACVHRRVCGA
jgi:hypothetical protein